MLASQIEEDGMDVQTLDLTVERLVVIHERDTSHASDGATGDSGDTNDGN